MEDTYRFKRTVKLDVDPSEKNPFISDEKRLNANLQYSICFSIRVKISSDAIF